MPLDDKMAATCVGNASILSHYFQHGGPTLYVNDSSFMTSLTLTSAGRVWQISLSGYQQFLCTQHIPSLIATVQLRPEKNCIIAICNLQIAITEWPIFLNVEFIVTFCCYHKILSFNLTSSSYSTISFGFSFGCFTGPFSLKNYSNLDQIYKDHSKGNC